MASRSWRRSLRLRRDVRWRSNVSALFFASSIPRQNPKQPSVSIQPAAVLQSNVKPRRLAAAELCVRFILQIAEMKILQISSARSLGGGERHLIDLTNSLARRGHDLYVALVPDSPSLSELKALPSQNILKLPLRNSLDIGSALTMSRFVLSNQIEIIHAHRARDYPLAALAARQNGSARLVITRHVLFPLGRIHRLVLRRAGRVIAVSQAVADSLVAQAIFSPEKIVVIHNGIDIERFARKQPEDLDRRTRFRVGIVGELSPIKGQDDFLKAASIISATRDDVDFIIAGEDASRSGENRTRLERMIDELELRQRVRITGWAEGVAQLLSSFDVLVSASHSESFGIAMIEAMACGVPVVASATGGAQEIIDEDETGCLVPVANAEALAKSITELLNDRNRRQRLATNALQAVRERFSLERMVDLTEQVYEQALDSPKQLRV
jgi:glycosyltransferase involved in cell wall biosynthesis